MARESADLQLESQRVGLESQQARLSEFNRQTAQNIQIEKATPYAQFGSSHIERNLRESFKKLGLPSPTLARLNDIAGSADGLVYSGLVAVNHAWDQGDIETAKWMASRFGATFRTDGDVELININGQEFNLSEEGDEVLFRQLEKYGAGIAGEMKYDAIGGTYECSDTFAVTRLNNL